MLAQAVCQSGHECGRQVTSVRQAWPWLRVGYGTENPVVFILYDAWQVLYHPEGGTAKPAAAYRLGPQGSSATASEVASLLLLLLVLAATALAAPCIFNIQ